MKYMKMLLIYLAVAVAAAVAMTMATPANAAQNGLQQIHIEADSWSSVYTNFACGLSYNVPAGATWGEGQANPRCGSYTYQAEPNTIYVGPGWCVTFWYNDASPDAGYRPTYVMGAGTGTWFRVWIPGYSSSITYHAESWYGSWCPTSGGARTG